jgi:acyl-homoserine lactone synthase
LNWDVPVIEGRFEKDRFDDHEATYLIALDKERAHAGSMRLLPTTKSHILSELFPALCEGAIPHGPDTFEITRLCLPTRHGALKRLTIRNALISAMVDHTLERGIDTLTGVVEASFLEKILNMGWRCKPLGPPERAQGTTLQAFRIDIRRDTPELLSANGIYLSGTITKTLGVAA